MQNGVLVCPEEGGGNLLTEEEFDNFIFRFEFKLTPGGNNGVGIRAPSRATSPTPGWRSRFSIMEMRSIKAG